MTLKTKSCYLWFWKFTLKIDDWPNCQSSFSIISARKYQPVAAPLWYFWNLNGKGCWILPKMDFLNIQETEKIKKQKSKKFWWTPCTSPHFHNQRSKTNWNSEHFTKPAEILRSIYQMLYFLLKYGIFSSPYSWF